MKRKRLSVIIPCFNEAENIPLMYKRLKKVFSRLPYEYEFVFVNNGSTDNSQDVFKRLARNDRNVMVVRMSRSFYGSQGSYTAGMNYVTGAAIILIDGDLQDPPEIIPKLIKKWETGYEVVYGVRTKRRASAVMNVGYEMFYKIFQKLSYIPVPRDAGDFSLMDRVVVDHINTMPERKRFIRGLRAWVGYKSIGVPYTRHERTHGKSNVPFLSTFSWASFAIFSFSYAPLTFISWLAFFVTALSGLGILVYLALYLLYPEIPRGVPTLIILVLFMGAVQLICFSIIAQYLAIMFEEIKGRPKFIVKDVLNGPIKRETI